MNYERIYLNRVFALFFIVLTVSLFQEATAQNDKVTGEDLKPLFPESLGSAVLQEFEPMEKAAALGYYMDMGDFENGIETITIEGMHVSAGEPVLLAGGTLTVESDGALTLDSPTEAGRYTIRYSAGNSPDASVSISVQGDGPIAVGYDFSTPVDETLRIEAPGLLDREVLADDIQVFVLNIALGDYIEHEVLPRISMMQLFGVSDYREWSVQGNTLHHMFMNESSYVFSLMDQIMVSAMAEGYHNPEEFTSMMEDFDISKLSEWSPPGMYEQHTLTSDLCLTLDCFSDKITACEKAEFGVAIQGGVAGSYIIEEAVDKNQCIVSFRFKNAPHEQLTDQTVYFPVDSDADISDMRSFTEALTMSMRDCVEGNSSSPHCSGFTME